MRELPHRGRVKVGNKWKSAGSFKIDILTKSVGRLVKHTGVFPKTKNATDLVRQMKLMLKELDTSRDRSKLEQIKSGKVTLLDALTGWHQGRLSFTDSYAGDLLRQRMKKWLPVSGPSVDTREQWTAFSKRLEREDIITDSTKVHEIPDILRRLRNRFEVDDHPTTFNHYRTFFLSFLVRELGYDDDDSFILKQTRRVKKLPIKNRREHHPLPNPHDFLALVKRINTKGRWERHSVEYATWCWFMALHGLRPTEFARGLWERDKVTGHIRITGTKTKNSTRVVPNIAWLKPEPRRLANLQMRLLNLKPATLVRTRDFRRTASLWWEAAGVPRSRYRYYMGHGPMVMTDRYQQTTPSEQMLNEDKELLGTWLREQLSAPVVRKRRVWSPNTAHFLEKLMASQGIDTSSTDAPADSGSSSEAV